MDTLKLITPFIPKKFHVSLGKRTLNFLAKHDKEGVVARLIEDAEKPSLDIAFKAKANCALASFRLRDKASGKTLCQTSVNYHSASVEKDIPATTSVRLSVGDKASVAHFSGNTDALAARVAPSHIQKDGETIIRGNSGGDIVHIHIKDEQALQEFIKKTGGEGNVKEFNQFLNELKAAAAKQSQ